MSGKYDAILDMERPVSLRHPPMERSARAAQFSPFAALTGYDDVIRESGRRTEERRILDEDMKRVLDARLQEALLSKVETTVEYFVDDGRKSGGAYVQSTGIIRKVDAASRSLTMDDGTTIKLSSVVDIR